MTCSHCQSQNTQPQIIKKDKKARVMLTFVITFFVVGILSLIGFSIAGIWVPGIYVGFFVIGLPISIIASIISIIVPAKNVTVFICNDCGKTTKV